MRVVLGLLIAGALMVGCGSGSGSTSVATQSDDAPAESTSFADIEYQSPLADFLGQDTNGFEFDEAAMLEEQRNAERAIVECMAEKGFEYQPQDVEQMMSFSGPPSDEFEPGSTEWINKYGFGISTQRFPQSMVGDLVGMSDEGFMGPGEDFVDPNAEYVDGLSDGERDAYFEALHGQPPDFGPEGPDEDFVFEPDGCQFEAFRDGPGGGGDSNVRDFYQAFGDEVQALQERIEADGRIVAFNAEVSSCVAEAGMEWTSIRDVYEQFEPRMRELQPQAFSGGDPFEAAGLDPENMSDRELDEFYMELNRLDPGQLALLAEIQAEEIALAQEVIACGGGPVNEQVIRNEVRVEYEQAFLDENAEELAEFAGES